MSQLAHQRHRLQPPEDLLDALALYLTDGVARVPRGARVGPTAPPLRVLCHVRRRLQEAHALDERLVIEQLVAADRDPRARCSNSSTSSKAPSVSAAPSAMLTCAPTASPSRLSIKRVPRYASFA